MELIGPNELSGVEVHGIERVAAINIALGSKFRVWITGIWLAGVLPRAAEQVAAFVIHRKARAGGNPATKANTRVRIQFDGRRAPFLNRFIRIGDVICYL